MVDLTPEDSANSLPSLTGGPENAFGTTGGPENAFGLPGQAAPGWDLDERGFDDLCGDLGFSSAEDYIVNYKAKTPVPQPKL